MKFGSRPIRPARPGRWLIVAAALWSSAARADVPRLDVLCGARLESAARAGDPVPGAATLSHLRVPLSLVHAHLVENQARASRWSRFKGLFVTSVDDSAEQVYFREEDLHDLPSAVERRDWAHAIQHRLMSLVTEYKRTPEAAFPLHHVLRGRAAILAYLRAVRDRAFEVQAELDHEVARELDALATRKLELRAQAFSPRPPTRVTRAAVLAVYGALAAAVTAWAAPHAGGLTPVLALGLGAGGWFARNRLYSAVRYARFKFENRREAHALDRRVTAILNHEDHHDRAVPEVAAIDEMIALVSADEPTSTFAFYSHTVDLPMPLAEDYFDDPPLSAAAVLEAVRAGHTPFIGGRRAQVTESLHWELGEPVLFTVAFELLQPGIADTYLMD